MDAGLFGGIVTVIFFALFILILIYVFRRGNKSKFEDAANLPFQEDASEARKPDRPIVGS